MRLKRTADKSLYTFHLGKYNVDYYENSLLQQKVTSTSYPLKCYLLGFKSGNKNCQVS